MTLTLKSILLYTSFFTFVAGYAQEPKEEIKQTKKEIMFEHSKQVVKSGNFIFKAEKAYPSKAKNFVLTNAGHLKIAQKETEANLPYSSPEAINNEASVSPPIRFHAPIENYRVTINEKKYSISISFQTIANRDTYTVSIHVGKLGRTKVTISSENYNPISYTGTLKKL